MLFESAEALADFVTTASVDQSLGGAPGWAVLAREHLASEAAEFDFDEDGVWLFDPPSKWNPARRAEVVDRLNLLWDAANQFDVKCDVAELLGGGRGALLGHLADALMEGDESTLAAMEASDVRAAYQRHARGFFARCSWARRQ